ncbi:MAG: hypothetical protein IBJ18_06330 [Phycisphaerales bacterium]|nr:hypothetical protein [Phycisphaerales bacterium]
MSADTVRIMCPNLTCRKVLAVPTAARGKLVRCKNCGTNIKVPDRNTSSTEESPAESTAKKKAG